jgi:hypothetical protein
MRARSALAAKLKLAVRSVASVSVLSILAACAGHTPTVTSGLTATQEAAVYRSHAKANYAPPGPPTDPWGPYVFEASKRFDVPDLWIREVMRVESGGYQFRASGELTTSPVGAMGLMQLMPETYDEMRGRYALGDDAFDPHNNILAGAAYIREMYDAFGSPGFLAAYNAGPARLADYLTRNRGLPDETRRYVYMIGSRIGGVFPVSRSPAEQLAVNQLPISIPAGPRWARHTVSVASRERRRHEAQARYAAQQRHNRPAAPVEVAEAPDPRSTPHAAPHIHMALATSHGGFHLISPAMAAEPVHGSAAMGAHATHHPAAPSNGHAGTSLPAVKSSHATVSRARLASAVHESAAHTCRNAAHHKGSC